LTYLLELLVKEPFLHVAFHGAPRERGGGGIPRVFFYLHLIVLGGGAHLQVFPMVPRVKRDTDFQSLILHISLPREKKSLVL
jgi:hypothetical protein